MSDREFEHWVATLEKDQNFQSELKKQNQLTLISKEELGKEKNFYWLKVKIENYLKEETIIYFCKRTIQEKWHMQPSFNMFTQYELNQLLGMVQERGEKL